MGNQNSIPNTREQEFQKFAHHLHPNEIKELSATFNLMYPSGHMLKKDFLDFFSSLFPFGNSKHFSERLFHNINISQSGKIDINELLIAFTILFKGSMFEKLRWIFRFYDSDIDGVISKDELQQALEDINEMAFDSHVSPVDAKELVEEILKTVDNKSGFLTFNDFEILAMKLPECFKKLSFFSD